MTLSDKYFTFVAFCGKQNKKIKQILQFKKFLCLQLLVVFLMECSLIVSYKFITTTPPV